MQATLKKKYDKENVELSWTRAAEGGFDSRSDHVELGSILYRLF